MITITDLSNAIDVGVGQLVVGFSLLLYCFTILVWWWRRNKVASEMYACFTVIVFACLINAGLGLYVRVLGGINIDSYHRFTHSFIWEWRYTILNIAMAYTCVNITRKILSEMKSEMRNKRREKLVKKVAEQKTLDQKCQENKNEKTN